jgi:ribosomal protein S20
MPIIKSAKKQMRQDKRRYAQNLRVKRELKTATKAFETKPTFDGLKAVQSRIDTAVKKNVLKKNTGARRMKRLARLAKEAGVKIPAPKSTTKTATKKPAVKTATKPVAKSAAKKATTKKPVAKKTTAKK